MSPMECALIRAAWKEPVSVLAIHADAPFVLALLSDGRGERGRWSYVMRDPDATTLIGAEDPDDPFDALTALLGAEAASAPDGPPFQGGVAGLCAYELGAAAEGLDLARSDWPDAVF